MKKKILTAMIAASMLISTGAVFAEGTDAPDIIELPTTTSTSAPASENEKAQANYVNVRVIVEEISENGVVSGKDSFDNPVEFTYDNAVVADDDGEIGEEIEKGDVVVIAVEASKPMTLQYPPRYAADAVAILDDDDMGNVNIDSYIKAESGRYSNVERTLELNVSEDTKIVDKSGKAVGDRNLDGKDLMVFYTITTMSIPAQTPPETIVVLGETKADNKVELPEEEENNKTVDFTGVTKIKAGDKEIAYVPVVINGKVMVPVRPIAEGIGLDVIWNDDQSINLGVAYNFKIGRDSYYKGRMAPIELGQAPVIIEMGEGGTTYVPVEMFTEIMETECTVENGVAVFK